GTKLSRAAALNAPGHEADPCGPWSDRFVLHRAAALLDARRRRLAAREQRAANAEVVHERADQRPDAGPDDRYPQVAVDVAVVAGDRHLAPAGDQGEQARTEVARGV